MTNKFGTVHSGYDPILPLGKKLCLRFMLDDFQNGDFWFRRMCDHDKSTPYIYLEKRTYADQICQAIRENVSEIFFCIDTPENDFKDILNFIKAIIYWTRSYGFTGEIIISLVNEPLEHMTVSSVHNLNQYVSGNIKSDYNISFACGEMACDFRDYYKTYLDCDYQYDYISFHTDNSCDLIRLKKFLDIFPTGTKFINNEHYFYNGAQEIGYNNTAIVKQFESYTRYLLSDNRIKSVYICMPYHAKGVGKYPWLGLNKVNLKNDKVYETLAWKMLKQYDIKAVIKMYLKEVKIDDRDFQVRSLQKALNTTVEDKLKVDGWFGSKTREALTDFNVSHNVSNPTVCSYATWYELLQSINTELIVKDLIDLLKVIE